MRSFAALLKPIVETIDQRGLKQRFLAKHRIQVDRFYRDLSKQDFQSERAQKCKKRFEKNRDKLFTFLSYDGVPWNNNNAEHAVKAFAKIRDIVRGTFTARTVRNSLVLLSICQTCKYSGVSFFDFMRSGELDVYTFLQRQRLSGRGMTIGQYCRRILYNLMNGKAVIYLSAMAAQALIRVPRSLLVLGTRKCIDETG